MMILEVDGLTNTSEKREATAEEVSQREIDKAAKAEQIKEAAAKAAAKAAVLDRLGITAEEAALLLG
jgi:phosphoribosylaminoimidazole-succinocarboxamide synthase